MLCVRGLIVRSMVLGDALCEKDVKNSIAVPSVALCERDVRVGVEPL